MRSKPVASNLDHVDYTTLSSAARFLKPALVAHSHTPKLAGGSTFYSKDPGEVFDSYIAYGIAQWVDIGGDLNDVVSDIDCFLWIAAPEGLLRPPTDWRGLCEILDT